MDRPSVGSPDLLRQLDDQAQLVLLRAWRDRIALGDAGEAALRAHRQTRDVDVAARRIDAALQVVLLFHRGRLGGDEAQNDVLVSREVAQRREIAGPRAVILEEK